MAEILPLVRSISGGVPRSGSSSISIVISDASRMACELLAGALSGTQAFTILKSSINSTDTTQAILELKPDIALISSDLADGPYSGFRTLRDLRSTPTNTRYIIMVENAERDAVVDAFRAGAHGIFPRSSSVELLARCVSAVHNGQVWANSTELQHVLEALQSALPLRCTDARGKTLLSRREQHILPLVADGLTNKEIGRKLGVSEHTVKNHLFRIYEKLGISSRVELILYAVTQREEAA